MDIDEIVAIEDTPADLLERLKQYEDVETAATVVKDARQLADAASEVKDMARDFLAGEIDPDETIKTNAGKVKFVKRTVLNQEKMQEDMERDPKLAEDYERVQRRIEDIEHEIQEQVADLQEAKKRLERRKKGIEEPYKEKVPSYVRVY